MFKFTTAIVAAAAITATASAPAFAETSAKAKMIERNGKTFYCVKNEMTGSRMAKQVCLTKEEWSQRGVTVAAAKNDAALAANPQPTNQN
jgi:Spy/CpxP family protein refolding chaperone